MPARFDEASTVAVPIAYGVGLVLFHIAWRLAGRPSLTARLLDHAIRRLDAAWQRRYYDL